MGADRAVSERQGSALEPQVAADVQGRATRVYGQVAAVNGDRGSRVDGGRAIDGDAGVPHALWFVGLAGGGGWKLHGVEA